MATWEEKDLGEVRCEACNAVYHVTSKQFPIREKGRQVCEVCGHEMSRWKGTVDFFYKLIRRPSDREV